jgi:aminoglycoside phosphotransferase
MNLAEIKKSLPSRVAEAIDGYAWRQNHVGFSSVRVFRLEAENKKSLYLKIDAHASKFSLLEEKKRLDWLKNRLPVPEVFLFAEDENNAYLLMSAISGVDASDASLKGDIPRVIEELANGLKMIHSMPVENCPFNTTLDDKIETARERMTKNLVEEEDFDEERLGRTPQDVFQEMLAAKPTSEDLVFTHGDYCIPNVILENRRISGFIDWAEARVADRFQDLALLSRSVKDNFGAEYEEKVFEIYGIAPDREKIHFYRLLDEFF